MEQVATMKLTAMFRHRKPDQCSAEDQVPHGFPGFASSTEAVRQARSKNSLLHSMSTAGPTCVTIVWFSSPFLEWVQEHALFIVNRISFVSNLTFRKSPGLYWDASKTFGLLCRNTYLPQRQAHTI
jgi:hypothetical protein